MVGIIILDTLQASGTIDYIDKGLFVNHYYCTNKEKKTLFKGTKYTCPKIDNDKEILETTIDCIHNYSKPIATLRDGGTEIYKYEVYYLVKCNKIKSKVKDILIGQNQEN